MKYIAIGVKKKSEALREKKKAVNQGFKGVKIDPYISYGTKRPSHYDVTYDSINPLVKKIKVTKCKKVITYMRKTPKGMRRVSRDIIKTC